ncbi:hypothetical protein R5W24_005975 [Gemmata sp. JC717]|uniref:DUF3108 domain-containing protein n=1 Tax=Gemmata algarum TaxID=2975278 RepID=A0ABU5F308_9BACT|nr:hypothetical protein [Gemmata algarum]MDY3556802.1 hypothetical protein [Gemmata algarum]MDY3561574.1 hypothetical protein [Gemmata algarum]
MLRAIRLFVGAALVLFGGTLLAQAPKDAPQAEGYFPLKVNAKWTYKVGDNTIEVKVVKVDKVGGEEQYQVDTVVGKDPKTSEWYTVKGDGVYRVRVKDDKLDPAVKVLPLPIKKDATWDINSKVGTQTVKGAMKVLNDKEKIKVGETEYEAVFVEGKDLDIAGAKTTVRLWFAKGKGIVKEEFVLQTNEVVKLELTKYEEGK